MLTVIKKLQERKIFQIDSFNCQSFNSHAGQIFERRTGVEPISLPWKESVFPITLPPQ